MKNALILHGTQGNSQENWFPWLKKELEKKGYKVWLPDLPGANEPDLKVYNNFLLSNDKFTFNSETIMVGHSSGAVEILALLNQLSDGVVVDKCVLVAPFGKNSTGGKWEANKKLFEYKFDMERVKNKAKKFVLIISNNDPYGAVEYVHKLGKELSGEVVVTHGDGHFSASSGGPKYKKLPLLLDYIK